MNDNNMMQDPSMDVRGFVAQRQQQLDQENHKHGDVVTDKDGVAGIYIDKQEVIRKELESPQINAIQDKLSAMDDQIKQFEQSHGNIAPTMDDDANSASKEQAILGRVNPNNPETADLRKVAEAFAEYDIGAEGLVPKGAQPEPRRVPLTEQLRGPVENTQVPETTNAAPVVNNNTTTNYDGTHRYVDSDVPTMDDKNVVQFNVPAQNTREFINSMTNEEMKKVSKASTIIVNEVKEMNIPVASRTITSFDEFKRVVNRHTEVDSIETVLMNSGYMATFKGCGALAMATLLPTSADEPIDYGKQYQFCYDNLINTSIGKLSYNEFCLRTHLNDLPTCLLAILRASDPDESQITLECAECKTEYDVKYRLSELLDLDSITDEMNAQVEKVANARHTYEDAMKAHLESPVMQVKYAQVCDDNTRYTIEIKPANGNITIERVPLLRALAAKYSQYVAAIITYIPKITIEILDASKTKVTQTFDVADPYAIAEIMTGFNLDTVRAIGKIITSVTQLEYPSPTYSFKGKFKCPKCGREEEHIRCTIESLVFYRAGAAMQ